MKKLLVWLCFMFLLVPQALAIEKIGVNNKFGMHLAVASDEDLKAVAKLVNSNGGQYGYVTLVIPDNDLNVHKWQAVFDQIRKLQLIPIVRLATHGQDDSWVRPKKEDAKKWLRFLNSLNWVTKNRYVILFNEPNHATEWGGRVDSADYAEVALSFAKILKENNNDYFVMLAGLDQAAPQQLSRYASAEIFLTAVIKQIGIENFKTYIDGLSSHSYPNPGFVGLPYQRGWGTVAGYEAELALLQSLGVSKELPVFITETGWQRGVLDEQTVADYFVTVFNNLWLPDTRVVAVTPFILNYQSDPFLGFSWQKKGNSDFYLQYQAVEELTKIKGRPVIEENISFLNRLPEKLVEDSSFLINLTISNLGQGYWDSDYGYELRLISKDNYYYRFSRLSDLVPGTNKQVTFEFHTPKKKGQTSIKIGLFHDDKKQAESAWWQIKIMPLQKLKLSYRLLNFNNNGHDFKILLYDNNEHLVYETGLVNGHKGQIQIEGIRNVALGEKYRVVLLKPGYLPRQTFVVFKEQNNQAKLKLMWPLDWNQDGQWSLLDFKALFVSEIAPD